MENKYDYPPREWINNDILSQILGGDDMHGKCECYGDRQNRTSKQNDSRNIPGNSRSSCSGKRDRSYTKASESSIIESKNSSHRSAGTLCAANNRVREYNDTPSHCCNERCANDERMHGFPIAMAYVPIQEWHELYEADDALSYGTLFSELNLPFNHSSCGRDCGCR